MPKKSFYWAFIVLMVLTANSAIARPWFIEPQLNLSGGYDDNPGLVASSPTDTSTSSTIFVNDGGPLAYFGADIRLGSETETDLIAFDFSALARRYNNAPELDSEYLLASALYQKRGQNNDFDIEIGYTRDSTLETELLDTGRFDQNLERSETYIRPTLTSRFSSLWVAEFELGYGDISFEESNNPEGLSTFVDYEDFDGSVQLSRFFSQRLRIFGLLEFLRYRPTQRVSLTDVEKDDFKGLQFGFEYDINERMVTMLSAGRGFTDTDISGIDETIEFRKPIYNASIEYAGDINTLRLDFSRTYESSGTGSLALTESISLMYSRLNTFGGTLSIPVIYIKRDPERAEEAGLDAERREYYEIAPILTWDISPKFSVTAQLRYRDQELSDTLTDLMSHTSSTAAILGVRYEFGRKRIRY